MANGWTPPSTTLITDKRIAVMGDLLEIRPGDIVFCLEQLEKVYGQDRVVMPAYRLMVFYGFTKPGTCTIYGTFDGEEGAQFQAHKQIFLWQTPLYLYSSGLLLSGPGDAIIAAAEARHAAELKTAEV